MTTATASVVAYLPQEIPCTQPRFANASACANLLKKPTKAQYASYGRSWQFIVRGLEELSLRDYELLWKLTDKPMGREKGQTLVHFFGTDDLAWVNGGKAILSWDMGLQLSYHPRELRKQNGKLEFVKAFNEVDCRIRS